MSPIKLVFVRRTAAPARVFGSIFRQSPGALIQVQAAHVFRTAEEFASRPAGRIFRVVPYDPSHEEAPLSDQRPFSRGIIYVAAEQLPLIQN